MTKTTTNCIGEELFMAALSLTSIRAEGTVSALRLHMVKGLPKGRVCEMTGVDKSLFRRRLVAMNNAMEKGRLFAEALSMNGEKKQARN